MVNWTNEDVLEARNRLVRLRNRAEFRLKLWSDGWHLQKELGEMPDPHIAGADIWTVRYFLNETEAVVVPLI